MQIGLAELHPRRFFLETWREMDREAEEARRARGNRYDVRPAVALLGGAVLLTAMEYYGMPGTFRRVCIALASGEGALADFARELPGSAWWDLGHHAWWAITRVLGFFVFPALLVRATGERIRDQGLSTKGFASHLWVYGVAYVFVLGLVFVVSRDSAFTEYYPFYRRHTPYGLLEGGADRSWLDFGAWELLYAAQFFSLEFFFRGWWLRACKETMGSHAIFVMVVPYVMIHFGKPVAETFAASIAGVVLGTLAMRTRSIWGGVLIHVAVAVSMDVAALLRTNGLPTQWTP